MQYFRYGMDTLNKHRGIQHFNASNNHGTKLFIILRLYVLRITKKLAAQKAVSKLISKLI